MILSEIYAICLREIRKAWAEKVVLLLSAFWPLFMIFVMGIGINSFVDMKNVSGSYVNFLGPGIIAMFSLGHTMAIGNSIIDDRLGFVKEMLVSPINRSSIFIGKILGSMVVNFSSLIVAVMVFLAFVGNLSFKPVFWSLFFMMLIAFGFYGFGIIMGFMFKNSKSYMIVSGFVSAFFIFFAGIFFPVSNLPFVMKVLVRINPLTYGVDGLRYGLIGTTEFGVVFDILFLAGFSFLTILIGSLAFKKSTQE